MKILHLGQVIGGLDIYIRNSIIYAEGDYEYILVHGDKDNNKPIVATNVGCFPEYIEDGIDGIIVPALDAMALRQALEKLLDNDELRRIIGKNGFEKLIYKFSNDEIAKKYMSIFISVSK